MKIKILKLIIISLAIYVLAPFCLIYLLSGLLSGTGQDSEYDPNQFWFKLDAAGNIMPATATNHTCVLYGDSMWEVKTDDGGLRDKDWTYTWYNSNLNGGNTGTVSSGSCYTRGRCDTEKFVADVNAQGLCGHNDWRLPSYDQLGSMVEDSTYYYSPYIGVNYFPNTVSNWFWTVSEDTQNQSAYLYDTSFCSIVRAYHTFIYGNYRDGSYAVRLMRNVGRGE